MSTSKPIVNKGQLEVALLADAAAAILSENLGKPIVIVANHGTRAYPVRKMQTITLFDEVSKADVEAVVFSI